MEAHRHFGKSASGGMDGRRTAILVAGVSALAAAVLIYLFVTHYRKAPAPVLVPQDVTVLMAKQYIPVGTPQSQLAAGGLLKPERVPPSQVVLGALSDPAAVAGQDTSVAIEAGQQVTAGDFSKTVTNSITSYLKGDERGVGFTFDSQHGLTGFLQPNSTVDIMDVNSKSGNVKLLLKDVTVISNTSGLVVLRLTDKQALLVAAGTTGSNSLWLSLRPTIKATNSIQVGEVGSVGSF